MFLVTSRCTVCGALDITYRSHVHPVPKKHIDTQAWLNTSYPQEVHDGPMEVVFYRDLEGIGAQWTKAGYAPSPQEIAMSQPWLDEALRYFERPIVQFHTGGPVGKTPEQKFRELDVRVGDRIRLTTRLHAAQDASVIEGRILGIKERDGGSQVRVAGFDHTGGGAGGQHVWFPVSQYTVEVLRKSYRWTTDDKIVAEIAGYAESTWEGFTETNREAARRRLAKRVARIKKSLGVSDDSEV